MKIDINMFMKHILTFSLLASITICSTALGHATSYNEIIINHKNLTGAQFDEFKKSILDEKVEWEGTVYNVTKNWLDENFEVQVDMNDDDFFDVTFDINKQKALLLAKGGKVKFSGSISHIINLFGSIAVVLDNVSIKDDL